MCNDHSAPDRYQRGYCRNKKVFCRALGFSLIEVVITLALLATLVGVGAQVLGPLFEAYFFAKTIIPAASEGQLAMGRMVREIRKAKFSTLPSPCKNLPSISFVSTAGDQIQFYQTQLGGPEIFMVKNNGEKKILAQHVREDSLKFTITNDSSFYRLVDIAFAIDHSLLSTAVHVESEE